VPEPPKIAGTSRSMGVAKSDLNNTSTCAVVLDVSVRRISEAFGNLSSSFRSQEKQRRERKGLIVNTSIFAAYFPIGDGIFL
jgi:hypothetical protein